MKFTRIQIYWMCQIVGWSLASFSDLVASKLYDVQFNSYNIYTYLFEVTVGMLITHSFRGFVIRKGWLQKSFLNVLSYIIPAALVMTLISLAFFIFLGVISLLVNPASANEPMLIPSNMLLIIYFVIVIQFLWYFVWCLIYFVYHAFENLQLEKIDKVKIEGKYKEIELHQLRSQLNPHFLFNALNSVRALIDEDPDRARNSITQLSHILRSALNVQNVRTITLKQEMEIVNDYLSLEKVRFDKRLEFELDLDNHILDFPIPPMLVQTLAENGIKHGIGTHRHGGKILIRAHAQDDLIHIAITSPGQLKDSWHSDSGHGVSNTIERLKIIYADKASFSLFNLNDCEVQALVTIQRFVRMEEINSPQKIAMQ